MVLQNLHLKIPDPQNRGGPWRKKIIFAHSGLLVLAGPFTDGSGSKAQGYKQCEKTKQLVVIDKSQQACSKDQRSEVIGSTAA